MAHPQADELEHLRSLMPCCSENALMPNFPKAQAVWESACRPTPEEAMGQNLCCQAVQAKTHETWVPGPVSRHGKSAGSHLCWSSHPTPSIEVLDLNF